VSEIDAVTSERRARMIDVQLRGRGIADERVLEVMGALPREAFVPASFRERAYEDVALPIPDGQSISQPYMVARMTELIQPRAGLRVLEIGTGSGYQAAVLAMLGCEVLSIERHPDLAAMARRRIENLGLSARVLIDVGDGGAGSPAEAPFEGIVVTAATPRVPMRLVAQLVDDGRLVAPVGPRTRQALLLVTRRGPELNVLDCGPCLFVPLVGVGGYPDQPWPPDRPGQVGRRRPLLV
jgi:protein-L-isoaspartate(D-aspartate) O-methyltransferase